MPLVSVHPSKMVALYVNLVNVPNLDVTVVAILMTCARVFRITNAPNAFKDFVRNLVVVHNALGTLPLTVTRAFVLAVEHVE